MEFRFNMGQRVVVPGTKGLQGIIIGRKEFLDPNWQPDYEIRWLGDDARITSDTCPQDVLERAQPGYVAALPMVANEPAPFVIKLGDRIFTGVDFAGTGKRKRPKRKSKLKRKRTRSRSRR